jgi:hypothetical protein
LQPRKFYANISVKPHFPLCQLTLWRVSVILCTTVIVGSPTAPFTPYFHMELHNFCHTNIPSNPLHKSCPDR